MTTFLDDDSSIERGKPVELYTFTSQRFLTPIVARSTSYHRSMTVLGIDYTARPIRRGAAPIFSSDNNVREMTVEVAASDPAAMFYMGTGVPPQSFECVIQRLQQTSGQVQDIFRGVISDAQQNGRTVTFTITQRSDDALQTKFPTVQISKLCQHTLFDSRCTVVRTGQQVNTTISAIGDFRTVTVASISPFVDGQFVFGELLHQPSGERRHIVKSFATRQLTLDVRLPSTAVNGDGVVIWRGCDRRPATCRDRFANITNFSGANFLSPRKFVFSTLPMFNRLFKPEQ